MSIELSYKEDFLYPPRTVLKFVYSAMGSLANKRQYKHTLLPTPSRYIFPQILGGLFKNKHVLRQLAAWGQISLQKWSVHLIRLYCSSKTWDEGSTKLNATQTEPGCFPRNQEEPLQMGFFATLYSIWLINWDKVLKIFHQLVCNNSSLIIIEHSCSQSTATLNQRSLHIRRS